MKPAPLRLIDPNEGRSTTPRANELWALAQRQSLEEIRDYVEQLETITQLGDELLLSLAPVGMIEVIRQTQRGLIASRQTLTALLERQK